MIALTIAFALIVAPLVVILTHGPAAHASVLPITAEISAHGHDHSHDHTHDHAGQDGPIGGHNPADHDHQLQALICPPATTPAPLPDKSQWASSNVFRHLALEGPTHPPRSV